MTEHLGATKIAGPPECSRILLVGELNPYSESVGVDRYALHHQPTNSAGGRLQRLIFGVNAIRWYLPMWRVNLCSLRWGQRAARARAASLLLEAPWNTVVMLGARVFSAFSQVCDAQMDPFEIAARGPITLVYLPHPSGLNRVWAKPQAIQQAREVMRSVAPGIPWGEEDK